MNDHFLNCLKKNTIQNETELMYLSSREFSYFILPHSFRNHFGFQFYNWSQNHPMHEHFIKLYRKWYDEKKDDSLKFQLEYIIDFES